MSKLKQYEFSIEIDEYIFNRFVKNKLRKPIKIIKNTKRNFLIVNVILF